MALQLYKCLATISFAFSSAAAITAAVSTGAPPASLDASAALKSSACGRAPGRLRDGYLHTSAPRCEAERHELERRAAHGRREVGDVGHIPAHVWRAALPAVRPHLVAPRRVRAARAVEVVLREVVVA